MSHDLHTIHVIHILLFKPESTRAVGAKSSSRRAQLASLINGGGGCSASGAGDFSSCILVFYKYS